MGSGKSIFLSLEREPARNRDEGRVGNLIGEEYLDFLETWKKKSRHPIVLVEYFKA